MNSPSGNATWTGYEFALAVAADFEAFFDPAAQVNIPVSVEKCNFPCVRTNANGSRIVIPEGMASEEIDGPDRLFFHLIILGHEIAHIVHRHTQAVGLECEDDAALELWADFYGAKVMMTVVTFGTNTNAFFRRFFAGDRHFEEPLESIGRACGRLVDSVYTDHERYPRPLTRVGLILNGVVSFIRHHSAGTEMDPIWYYSVFKRIFAPQSIRDLMLLRPETATFDPEPIMRAMQWHKREQGSGSSIALGLNPALERYLHTTFDQTDEERAASFEARLEEFRDGPYDLDLKNPFLRSPDQNEPS